MSSLPASRATQIPSATTVSAFPLMCFIVRAFLRRGSLPCQDHECAIWSGITYLIQDYVPFGRAIGPKAGPAADSSPLRQATHAAVSRGIPGSSWTTACAAARPGGTRGSDVRIATGRSHQAGGGRGRTPAPPPWPGSSRHDQIGRPRSRPDRRGHRPMAWVPRRPSLRADA